MNGYIQSEYGFKVMIQFVLIGPLDEVYEIEKKRLERKNTVSGKIFGSCWIPGAFCGK
jgi:hypothetical protein